MILSFAYVLNTPFACGNNEMLTYNIHYNNESMIFHVSSLQSLNLQGQIANPPT